MKKIFVSMMMVVALVTGGNISAQNTTDGTTGASKQKNECCQNGNEKKGDKKDSKKIKGKGDHPKFNPFDGIQLTDDQQQRLQILQQGLGPVRLDKEQQEKIKENSNLTPEQKQQLKEERKAKQLEAKKNYLNGVKEVLTPDQYILFLENVYLYAPQSQGKQGKMGPKEIGRHGEKKKGGKNK